MRTTTTTRTIRAMEAAAIPQQPPAERRKYERKLVVNGKNRAAIEAMVFEGLKRSEAAAKAGLTDHALYVALSKPHVKAYYLAQCEVLRTSGRARRLHRLEAMSEQDDNKQAAVNAILALERLAPNEDEARTATNSLPGLQIVIVQGGSAPPTIDVTPARSSQLSGPQASNINVVDGDGV